MQVNLGEPASEMYHSCSALGITVTASVAPIPSNHFPPFTLNCSITPVCVQIIHILVYSLFPCFPGPTCLSGSLSLQSNILFYSVFICPYHCNLFLWTTFSMSSIPNHCLNSMRDGFCLHEPPENRISSDSPFLRLYQRREK